MNYYRRFPGDYLRDTRRLNLLQHGAYTLLLDHLYATEERIATEQDAFRICQAATEEERWAVSTILTDFFKKTRSGFTNNRFEKEVKLRKNWRKWQKTHRHRDPDSQENVRPLSMRNPSPSPSPLKEREEKERSGPPPKLTEVETFARKSFERFWEAYPNQIDREVCFQIWQMLSPIDQDKAAESVPVWAKSEAWGEARFIPKPETFIRKRRWESRPPALTAINLVDRKRELEAKFESTGH